MRALLVLHRPVYLRHFASLVALLDARGHALELAFSDAPETVESDPLVVEVTSRARGGINVQRWPRPDTTDPKWRVATAFRLAGDFGRYLRAPFLDTPSLRSRATTRLVDGLASPSVPAAVEGVGVRLAERLCERPQESIGCLLTGAAGAVERAVRPPRELVARVRAANPDIVIVSPAVHFGSHQVDYLKAARLLEIPSALCVASWDNLTTKGMIRWQPDAVYVWNEFQRREAIELHDLDPCRTVVTGAPRFDPWFESSVGAGPRALRVAAGLDPDTGHLLYLCSSAFIVPDEVELVRSWGRAIRASPDPRLRRIGLLVRPHPQHAESWASVDLAEFGNAAVWPPHGAEAVAAKERAAFRASIEHASAVVGVNTSAQIEACILGTPVLALVTPDVARGQAETLHYGYLRRENGGFLWEATSLHEHLAQLQAALAGGLADERSRLRFIGSFVRPFGVEVPATPILADHLERLASRRRDQTGT